MLLMVRAWLERRNFTGIVQEFYRNQFNLTGKTQALDFFPQSNQALRIFSSIHYTIVPKQCETVRACLEHTKFTGFA